MAYEMAQTPVTWNDPEDHFSYLTLLTHFLGNMTRNNFNVYTRIRLHTWFVTLNELDQLQSFSNVSRLHVVQHFTRFQLACQHRAVPQRQLGFLST